MFYGFLIVENPTLGPIDALKKSQEMTKGRLGELFVFGLALFGINLVGALLCGIGLLFTYGITAIAVAYAYRTLTGEPVAPIAYRATDSGEGAVQGRSRPAGWNDPSNATIGPGRGRAGTR